MTKLTEISRAMKTNTKPAQKIPLDLRAKTDLTAASLETFQNLLYFLDHMELHIHTPEKLRANHTQGEFVSGIVSMGGVRVQFRSGKTVGVNCLGSCYCTMPVERLWPSVGTTFIIDYSVHSDIAPSQISPTKFGPWR